MRSRSLALFVIAVFVSVGLLILELGAWQAPWLAVAIGLSTIVAVGFRAPSPWLETTLLPTIWLVAAPWIVPGGLACYAPLVGWVLVALAHLTASRAAVVIAFLATLPWLLIPDRVPLDGFRVASMVCTAMSLLVFAWHGTRPRRAVRVVDMIVCSYSANTAYLAQQFAEGVEAAGARAIVHRHHHTPCEPLSLEGDALVVAYPVIGWNPPYPVFDMLVRDLPRGDGKPAYVLHSSAGGPENAFFLVWLVLALRGYRPVGRLGATFPVNVTTFRLGPQRVWAFLDKLLPRPSDIRLAKETGKRFARGEPGGLPFWLWPSPLFIANFPLLYKLINQYFYHPYVWKRRCNKCYLCVRACPTARIKVGADGYPKAAGRCALCYACANLCPTNALHAIALTEYGAQYRPRFPRLVVRNRPRKPKEPRDS